VLRHDYANHPLNQMVLRPEETPIGIEVEHDSRVGAIA
jgi:hypothetical protein